MWPWGNRHGMLKVIIGAALAIGVVNLVAVNVILINEFVSKPQQLIEQEEMLQQKLEQMRTALKGVHQGHVSLLEQVESIATAASSDNSYGKLVGNDRSMDFKNVDLCTSAFGVGKKLGSEDVNTLEVLESLAENMTVDSWKEQPSWNIKLDQERFNSSTNKLHVFLVPFSVNIPASTQTLEINFARYTRNILKHILGNLKNNSYMKFVWSEVFMFSIWWNQLHSIHRPEMKDLIENGQLEFVSGGWVNADQSSAHYYSLLTQLIEGRQFLHQFFNVTPNNGMELFGLSPTMAYLLNRAGTDTNVGGVVIQNAHNVLKRHLAEKQQLEFNWGQIWGEADVFCHLMPFNSYDQIHTCGPDPSVCYNFDFKKIFPETAGPKTSKPAPISQKNVKQRGELLVEQFRKKAMLFKTNNLLVLLGGDFVWENQREWDAQVDNYNQLISYVNSEHSLNVYIQFATLNDYFQALSKEVSGSPSIPTLTGDLFPDHEHSDHQMDYSSRPFLKEMERDLISHLRSAQIIFAQVCAEISRRYDKKILETSPYISQLLEDLVKTRRYLSLFQHYNALSGTASTHVMKFYAEKLLDGFGKSNRVLEKCVDILTHITRVDPNYNLGYAFELPRRYNPIIFRKSPFSLPQHDVFIIPNVESYERLCTVYNPVLQSRTQLITLRVTRLDVAPFDLDGKPLPFEIFPVFGGIGKAFPEILRDVYQLNVLLHLEPLSLKIFKIKRTTEILKNKPNIYQNYIQNTYSIAGFTVMPLKASGLPLRISNDYLTAFFNYVTGMATSVEVKVYGKSYRLFMVEFLKYDVKLSKTYTRHPFESDGPAKPLKEHSSAIFLVHGKLQSYLEVHFGNKITHRVTLYNFGDGDIDKYSLEVTNLVDIRQDNNLELIMRLKTGVRSEETFHTDLNGFQMIKRKRLCKKNSSKFPLIQDRKNYYAMSSSMFIEDTDLRITVLSKQPLGVTSLSPGEIEVMLDRRLNPDASGGTINRQHYGIQDNVLTQSTFKILFEKPTCRDSGKDKKPPMLSLASHLALQSLLHPPKVFSFVSDHRWDSSGLSEYSSSGPESKVMPCDIHLVDMPMIPMLQTNVYAGKSQTGLLVHRVGFDGTFLNTFPVNGCNSDRDQLGQFNLSQWTGDLFENEYQQMYLSFVKPRGKPLHVNSSVLLSPMEIYAFLVNFSSPAA